MTRNEKIGIVLSLLIFFIIIGIIIASLFIKPTFTVEFYSDGKLINSIRVKAKEKVSIPNDIQKEGSIFSGWYLEDELFDFNKEITRNLALVAKWVSEEKEMVTLTFDSLGGSKVDNIEIEVGTILENIPNPTKEGYLFQGWYYLNKAYLFNTPIKEDMTFVAKWKKVN